MSKCMHEMDFTQSPEEVFRFLDDEKLVVQWLSSLEAIVPITEGGNRVGARAKHIYNEHGRRFEMIEETLIYEPNRRVKIRAYNDDFELTAEYRLEPTASGTHLYYESDIKMHSIIMKFLSPFINAASRKQVVGDFDRLKALIEADALTA